MRSFFVLLAILLVFNAAVSSQPQEPRILQSDEVLQQIHDSQKNVGLSATVFKDGEIVYTKYIGYADLEFEVPVDGKTRFQVASVTKAFTGTALIKLLSENRISLDDDIRKYVDFPVKKSGSITIRQLALHIAGIRHYKNGEKDVAFLNTHYADLVDAIKIFENDELISTPGAEYHYSSFGYNLLALIIEKAAKKPFNEYVSEEIINPLKLSSTRFNDIRFVIPNRSRHYSFYDPITFKPSDLIMRVPDFDYSYNMGGGNLITTSEDLARFGQAFIDEGFLKTKDLALFYTKPSRISPWSYGWFVREKTETQSRRIHITGAFPGVQSCLFVYPENGISVAVLSNTWGIGSNSGEMVSDVPEKIADIWK